MSLKVLRAGLLSTLQDLGRYGFQKYGVNVAGAMDAAALRLANILVGNDEREAALEMALTGPTLEFTADTLIPITGGDFEPVSDGVRVILHCPVAVKAGAVLKFGACRRGCRAYLAVAGGYNVPVIMNSKSTYLRGAMGGHQGRKLQKGDVLDCGEPGDYSAHMLKSLLQQGAKSFRRACWFLEPDYLRPAQLARPVRITRGLQSNAFKEEALHDLVTKPFKITTSADRLGYRLQGPKLELKQPLEMISEIAVCGTVQVPPDGNPIILMADHQSVAGYPKIAQAIAADLPKLAQLRPGTSVQFELITVEEAERLYLEQEKYIENIRIAVKSRMA